MRPELNHVDVAIVGGGVSGLYTAWRLAASDSFCGTIAVYETSYRLGGKLWSYRIGEEGGQIAELGAMYFGDNHRLIHGLCSEALGLTLEPVRPMPFQGHIQGRRFAIADFPDAEFLQSGFAKAEKGLPYHGLFGLVLKRIVPEAGLLWPLGDRSRGETLAVLQARTVKGRALFEWGFGELLDDVLSKPAVNAVNGICGSSSLVANHNAYDMVVGLLYQFSRSWYQLSAGYQALTDRLVQEAMTAGVKIFKQHKLVEVGVGPKRSGDVALAFQSGEGTKTVIADRAILTLPHAALCDLQRNSGALRVPAMGPLLDAIQPVSACKLFLRFKSDWWCSLPDDMSVSSKSTYGYSRTDLPIRQSYFLGEDRSRGPRLVLAMFADGKDRVYWSRKLDSHSGAIVPFDAIPQALVEDAVRQLSIVHGVEVPYPIDGIFIDWAAPPFHGGWHQWRPGYRSWVVAHNAIQPVNDLNVHFCGDAFSPVVGWAEGALLSVEQVLQQVIGLPPAKWHINEQGN